MQRISGFAQAVAQRARRVPGVAVLEQTVQAYNEDHVSLLAAALAYYALLSIFPLMLFLLAVLSPFLESDAAMQAVERVIRVYLPTGSAVLRSTLREVTQLRGPLSLVAAVGFIWSASGVFDVLQLALNRAFNVPRARPVWRQRIVSLVMVIATGLLFPASLVVTAVQQLAIRCNLLTPDNPILYYYPLLTSFLVSVVIFGVIYRFVPYDPTLRWRDVWRSALLAAVLWELAKLGFAWYLTNLALLNLVYGSVGTIIAFMLWTYLTAIILLVGAELAAVLSEARERGRTTRERETASGQAPSREA